MPYHAPTTIEPQPDFIDFSKASLPAAPQVLEAAVRAANELPRHLGDPVFDLIGMPLLTAALAQRFTDRGLPTEPDQIMVTIGAQHAIALIARTLVARGDRVIIESPTYPHALEALKVAGGRPAPVPVSTEDGVGRGRARAGLPALQPIAGLPDARQPEPDRPRDGGGPPPPHGRVGRGRRHDARGGRDDGRALDGGRRPAAVRRARAGDHRRLGR